MGPWAARCRTGGPACGLRQPASRYPVTLYAAKNCPPCDVGRDLLVQRGIPFAEKRVDTHADLEAYVKFSGGRTLPC
jgi:hypothetical protein